MWGNFLTYSKIIFILPVFLLEIFRIFRSLNLTLRTQVVQESMDPREVIVLSSCDEMSIEPYQAPSDESDGRNRAFSGPVEMSLGSDDLHGGKDFIL